CFSLGGEEGSKKLVLVFRRNTNTLISYGDANSVLARLKMPCRPRTNQNPASYPGSINGIRDQVRKNLLKLSLRRANHQTRLDFFLDAQRFILQPAFVDGQDVLNYAGDAELDGLRIVSIKA